LPKDERQAELAVLGLNVPGGAAQGAFGADYKRRCGRAFSVAGVTSAFVHSAKLLLLFSQPRELFLFRLTLPDAIWRYGSGGRVKLPPSLRSYGGSPRGRLV
jgi:hypothetical protein